MTIQSVCKSTARVLGTAFVSYAIGALLYFGVVGTSIALESKKLKRGIR